MQPAARPNFLQQVRSLHRDVGYFTAGLTVIFALSGIAQIYRDTGLFQHEIQVASQAAPGLAASALGPTLRVRDFRVLRTEGSITYFPGGSYDAATGHVVRTEREFVFPIDRFAGLHKAPSKAGVHWLTTVYGVALLFMALSSFFMFRVGSRQLNRGFVLSALGLVVALVLLFMAPAS